MKMIGKYTPEPSSDYRTSLLERRVRNLESRLEALENFLDVEYESSPRYTKGGRK